VNFPGIIIFYAALRGKKHALHVLIIFLIHAILRVLLSVIFTTNECRKMSSLRVFQHAIYLPCMYI
jgi:hypothetical protein